MRIRKAQIEDVPSIISLIRDFAEFEKLSECCEISAERLTEAVFGRNAFVHCLTAFDGEELIGYALFFPVFKSFRGERSMFLEDLYVRPDARGRGAGAALFRTTARITRSLGFERMDWQVLKWNTSAADFYRALGAESDDENLDFRLRGEAFEKLAS